MAHVRDLSGFADVTYVEHPANVTHETQHTTLAFLRVATWSMRRWVQGTAHVESCDSRRSCEHLTKEAQARHDPLHILTVVLVTFDATRTTRHFGK